ncbi:MAG TPA: Crp/Fnr family transcriptional regulator [Allosphingosinicella sp.]|nr:Crp/Fnr family transcriptional regulator [Allosphingosinicella sp.]
MIEKLLMKLALRDEISAEEEAALRDAVGTPREVPSDSTIIRAGQQLNESTLLLDGLMCRYKDLRSGARQISELHVAGDFVDLHSFSLKKLDHSIMTLTPCTIVTVPHDKLKSITERYSHLTRLLWFSTNLDAAIHREWVLSLGRRTAAQRTAHLFCELYVRLEIVGLTDGFTFGLDLTQLDLAECLGLTSVHVNRTLKALREEGLIEFRSGVVKIQDMQGLARVAEFSTDYLSLEKQPR